MCIPKSLWQQPSSDAASPIFENSFNFLSLMTPVTEISETKSQHMNAWPRHGPVIKSSDVSMTSPVTPVELKVMAQFAWKLTEWKREKENRRQRQEQRFCWW